MPFVPSSFSPEDFGGLVPDAQQLAVNDLRPPAGVLE